MFKKIENQKIQKMNSNNNKIITLNKNNLFNQFKENSNKSKDSCNFLFSNTKKFTYYKPEQPYSYKNGLFSTVIFSIADEELKSRFNKNEEPIIVEDNSCK